MAFTQNGEMSTKTSAEPMKRMRMAASVEPMTVPTPPRIETPPTTEAVMTWSSRPGVATAWMVWNWVAYMTLAMPVKRPPRMNVVMRMRRVSSPERRAASALPPTAYCERPVRL